MSDIYYPNVIAAIAKEIGLKPSRDLGQNFLLDQTVAKELAAAAELKSDDVVVEVGPGLGALTRAMAPLVKRVIAVEKDRRLAAWLVNNLDASNVTVSQGDILKFNPGDYGLAPYGYKVAANLPYQITSAVLEFFLGGATPPARLTVLTQKEVAERITAKAGQTSVLSLSVQYYGRPRLVRLVSPAAFWPAPAVESAIVDVSQIKETTTKHQVGTGREHKKFFQLIKHGFSRRRKMLKNNLAAGYHISPAEAESWLVNADIKPTARAQELTLDEWFALGRMSTHGF